MAELERITVVGASLAGLRAAEALRREGFDGALTLVGEEAHFPPIDRPQLSKEFLADGGSGEPLRLKVFEGLEAQLLLGRRAISLDLDDRSVGLDDGARVAFDGLVIATGASPRTLPDSRPLRGVHLLRTYDDCVALRAELVPGVRVVIVGGGFIGAEVGATCRQLGLEVSVVEFLPFPMLRVLGEEMGSWAAELHGAHGVDLRLSSAVRALVGEERVEGVELEEGELLAADVVVVAVGVAPATEWLEGSGLILDNGVVCDAYCRALGASDVVAAGDVARWPNSAFGETMRTEHWTNAVEQGAVAARNLLLGPTGGEAYTPVPYVWSDQYDKKLQYVGVVGDYLGVREGSTDEGRFVATFGTGGRLVGALCVNWPARMVRYRRAIAAGTRLEELDAALG